MRSRGGGERVAGEVENIGNEIEEIISSFTPEEQKILERLLVTIAEKLMEKGLILSSDICTDCCFFKKDSNRGDSAIVRLEREFRGCESIIYNMFKNKLRADNRHRNQHGAPIRVPMPTAGAQHAGTSAPARFVTDLLQ